MATRFYPSETVYPVRIVDAPVERALPPAPTAEVSHHSGVRALKTTRTISVAGSTNSELAGAAPSPPYDVVGRLDLLSPALAAQTIGGTLSGQMRAHFTTTSNRTAFPQVRAYLVSPTGAIKATLYAGLTAASATSLGTSIGGTATNRSFPWAGPVNLASTQCAEGDRILLRIGQRHFSTSAGVVNLWHQSAGATDLPVDQTSTTDLQPWFEFSQTLTLAASDATPPLYDYQTFDGDRLVIHAQDVPRDSALNVAWTEEVITDGPSEPEAPSTGQLWPRGR